MPNNNSKDLLILQKLNNESNTKANKQRTLLFHIIMWTLVIVLLVMLFYGIMILSVLLKCNTW